MNLIQLFLFAGLLLIAFYVYRKLRSSLLDVIIIFLFVITGMVFISFPLITNKIANIMGVGRGADMIFYLSVVTFSFLLVKLYARVRRLEHMIHSIIRANSIAAATDNTNIFDPKEK